MVTNSDRAAWAEMAADTFGIETYNGRSFSECLHQSNKPHDDAYTMLHDLVADVMHLANQCGWNPEDIVRIAQDAYREEIEEEAGNEHS